MLCSGKLEKKMWRAGGLLLLALVVVDVVVNGVRANDDHQQSFVTEPPDQVMIQRPFGMVHTKIIVFCLSSMQPRVSMWPYPAEWRIKKVPCNGQGTDSGLESIEIWPDFTDTTWWGCQEATKKVIILFYLWSFHNEITTNSNAFLGILYYSKL